MKDNKITKEQLTNLIKQFVKQQIDNINKQTITEDESPNNEVLNRYVDDVRQIQQMSNNLIAKHITTQHIRQIQQDLWEAMSQFDESLSQSLISKLVDNGLVQFTQT